MGPAGPFGRFEGTERVEIDRCFFRFNLGDESRVGAWAQDASWFLTLDG